MPNRTEVIAEKAAAKEGLTLRVWALGGVVAGLLLFVQALMTFIITNAAAKMDSYSKSLSEVLTAVQVMNARNEALTARVASLEKIDTEAATERKLLEMRLRSVEQRVAIHDEVVKTLK